MYQVLARAIVIILAAQKIFYEFDLTQAAKWFDALFLSLMVGIANLNIEVGSQSRTIYITSSAVNC
ncbi:hypothetical protein D0A37_01690 [Microcoleus vaginatus HSN003]|nr:hypothetical protein D0A37_01690 [Microcoleus vaginatus HSN003]